MEERKDLEAFINVVQLYDQALAIEIRHRSSSLFWYLIDPVDPHPHPADSSRNRHPWIKIPDEFSFSILVFDRGFFVEGRIISLLLSTTNLALGGITGGG